MRRAVSAWLIVAVLTTAGCASHRPEDDVLPGGALRVPVSSDASVIRGALTNPAVTSGSQEDELLRFTALREAAYTAAFQAGAKWRQDAINRDLDKNGSILSRIFSFDRVLVEDGRVLPPVIVEDKGKLDIRSDTEAVSALVTYRIEQDAKIIASAPSWRDYLRQEYKAAESIHAAILPKNEIERKVWQESVEKGWDAGIRQANRVFEINLTRLERDYRGMRLASLLAKQGVLRLPRLAEGRFGVQIGDKVLDMDQRVFRLTTQSFFTKETEWTPLIGTPLSR